MRCMQPVLMVQVGWSHLCARCALVFRSVQCSACVAMLQGNTWPGWPVQMGEVQGQVLVADLNADGKMEIFAGESLAAAAAEGPWDTCRR